LPFGQVSALAFDAFDFPPETLLAICRLLHDIAPLPGVIVLFGDVLNR
jgi:hypothetical protein